MLPSMRTLTMPTLLLALTAAAAPAADPPKPAPSPGEIAAAAPASDWRDIAPDDLLVMTLAPDAKGKPRTVVIQLMPPPFSQPWVSNVRTLAHAHYWDGLSVYRVQDNYVAQWGDPEDDDKKARKLPDGLQPTAESDYVAPAPRAMTDQWLSDWRARATRAQNSGNLDSAPLPRDPYVPWALNYLGWPVASDLDGHMWPVHCYAMVGVARGQRPDAGNGATLYTVIGHAPRHLDRNIALAGRIVEGIEQLSSLPRGPGALGFYEDAGMRVPIVSVRLASDLPAAEQPHFQYLSTDSDSFARYADARANRRDPFFLVPAGGADICNIPVPIRRRP